MSRPRPSAEAQPHSEGSARSAHGLSLRAVLRCGPRRALAAAPLLLLAPPLRHALESRMALHMLLLFPLLLAAGWAAARCLPREPAALRRIDAQGLLGATALSCVAAWWMIPAALDASLVSAPLAAARLASWWLAGALLAGSWRRMGPEVSAFFFGNLAWMSATAGLLYQDADQRLCVNYLVDDQLWAGRGLVAAALLLGALALWRVLRAPPPAPARLSRSAR